MDHLVFFQEVESLSEPAISRSVFYLIVHTSISPKELVSCPLYACGSPQLERSARQDPPSPSGGSPMYPPGTKNQSNLTLTLINSTTLLFWWIHLLLFQRTQSLLERHGHFKRLTSKPKSTTWIIFLRVWRSWPVNAGSLQSDAGKVGGSAFVQEELGGEGGFWEATAAKEKIGLSLKGGLKIGFGFSNCPPLSSFSPGIVKSWKSAPSLIIPMCIIMRRRMRRVKKQTNPILAIFNKVQCQLKGGERKSNQLSYVAFY